MKPLTKQEIQDRLDHPHRIGRPTLDPKTRDIRVRVSEELYQEAVKYSKEHSQTLAETVREALKSLLT